MSRLKGDFANRDRFVGSAALIAKVIETERNRLETARICWRSGFWFRCWCWWCFWRRLWCRCLDVSRCRRFFTICKSFQFFHQPACSRVIDRAAITGRIGQIGKNICRFQHHFEHILIWLKFIGTNAIQSRLKNMGKCDEVIETKCTRTAFYRVNGPENGINRLGVAVTVIQFHETGFQFCELFLAFLEKDLFDFVHIHW